MKETIKKEWLTPLLNEESINDETSNCTGHGVDGINNTYGACG